MCPIQVIAPAGPPDGYAGCFSLAMPKLPLMCRYWREGSAYERNPVNHKMMMIGMGIPISQSNAPLSIKSSFDIVAEEERGGSDAVPRDGRCGRGRADNMATRIA